MKNDTILSDNITNSETLIMDDFQYLNATLAGDMVNSELLYLTQPL